MENLSDDNFDKFIEKAEKPILVDFFANWCPPCSILGPILEELESDFKERVIFSRINVDLASKIGQKFGIVNIPTVILFKDGNPVGRFIGLHSEEEIRNWLKGLLNQ